LNRPEDIKKGKQQAKKSKGPPKTKKNDVDGVVNVELDQ
jgi:hypothetical protein